MNKHKQKVLVIVGPTASGKSDLGVKLARKFKGEVISADSRQVYKGLNIGTGKITKKEMLGVPHHLLDVADPKKQFNGSDYKILGEEALRKIISKNKLPIVVGGTGFYVDILSCSINFPNVPPDPKFREAHINKSAETLFKMLQKKDPVRAKEVDRFNKLRLIRALEIVKALGKVPKLEAPNSPYEFIYVGIKPEDLNTRIEKRLMKRMPRMIKEAKKLHKNGLTYKRMEELGLEYKFLAKYLKGEMGKEEMTEKLNIAIRQYARRQMTWFKRNKKIKWFSPEEYKKIETHAINMLG